MAKSNIGSWTPVTKDTNVALQAVQPSAVMEAAGFARPLLGPVEVPRLLGGVVDGGCDLTDGGTAGDTVTMYPYLFNGKEILCDDQIVSASTGDASVFNAFDFNWLNSFHVAFDNAALGVSGARSGTVTDYRPYTSVYKAVRTADSGANYTADANYATGPLTYDSASATLGKLENSRYGNPSTTVIFAHPSLKAALRAIKDDNDRPIFMDGPNVVDDTLFGYRVYWTHGAIVSTNFKMSSTTNPLLIAANSQHLAWGQGQPAVNAPAAPASRIIPSSVNTASLATTLQYAAKEGFVLTVPQAASVLEVAAS